MMQTGELAGSSQRNIYRTGMSGCGTFFEEGFFMSFTTKRLVESAIMIALGTVLSLFPFSGP